MPTWDKEKQKEYYEKNRDELKRYKREWYLSKKEVNREVILNTRSTSVATNSPGTSSKM